VTVSSFEYSYIKYLLYRPQTGVNVRIDLDKKFKLIW